MSLHLKTAAGLVEISGSVTKEKIIQALGYVPADQANALDNIIDDGSGNLVITDNDGNIIMRVDASGINTTEVTANGTPIGATVANHVNNSSVHVTSAEKDAWNSKSDFSGSYADLADAPNIEETESGDMIITDNNSNIIMKVDQNGLETTSVTATTMIVDGIDVKSALESCGIVPDFSDIKDYVDDEIAKLVNSAPETLDTLGELATAFADNQDMVQTLNDAITNKADKADVMPADWNQNDENAADYVKNRTHYIEESTITVIAETTNTESIPLLNNELFSGTYIVTLDGVQYRCTTYTNNDGTISLGDSRLNMQPSEINPVNVPFVLECGWEGDEIGGIAPTAVVYAYYPDDATHTLSIAKLTGESTYHTLDEKFIPDTIARTEHIHNNYGVCSTGASTAAKTVQIDGFELRVGAAVYVKFTNSNSASDPTLNVSGTGAKPMYRYGTTVMSTGTTTTGWSAGAVQVFIYDGTGWVRDYWNNSTYSNASLGQGYGTCSTAAATVAKTAALSSYALSTGGIVAIKFSNDVCANATLNINSKGAKPIYYRGAAITDGVIKAGDIATFIYSTNYHLISIDSSVASVGVITNEEIDEICGGSIQYAEDVMF